MLHHRILKEMRKDYSSKRYDFSPFTFSAAIKQFCNNTLTHILQKRICEGKDLRVFNSTMIGPYRYWEFKNYFTDVTAEVYKMEIYKCGTFHVFNKESANENLSVHSNSLYVRAARDFCPISLASCSETF